MTGASIKLQAGLPSQPEVFISYRRDDALTYARLVQNELSERLPGARVFMDMDSIEPGLDFVRTIRAAIGSSRVMVVLIGPQWATIADEKGGRRLDDPHDYVRLEIRTAFRRSVPVIPLLVDGARAVQPQQLPADISRLARLSALEMSCDQRYHYDADRLIEAVVKAMVPLTDLARPDEGLVPQVVVLPGERLERP